VTQCSSTEEAVADATSPPTSPRKRIRSCVLRLSPEQGIHFSLRPVWGAASRVRSSGRDRPQSGESCDSAWIRSHGTTRYAFWRPLFARGSGSRSLAARSYLPPGGEKSGKFPTCKAPSRSLSLALALFLDERSSVHATSNSVCPPLGRETLESTRTRIAPFPPRSPRPSGANSKTGDLGRGSSSTRLQGARLRTASTRVAHASPGERRRGDDSSDVSRGDAYPTERAGLARAVGRARRAGHPRRRGRRARRVPRALHRRDGREPAARRNLRRRCEFLSNSSAPPPAADRSPSRRPGRRARRCARLSTPRGPGAAGEALRRRGRDEEAPPRELVDGPADGIVAIVEHRLARRARPRGPARARPATGDRRPSKRGDRATSARWSSGAAVRGRTGRASPARAPPRGAGRRRVPARRAAACAGRGRWTGAPRPTRGARRPDRRDVAPGAVRVSRALSPGPRRRARVGAGYKARFRPRPPAGEVHAPLELPRHGGGARAGVERVADDAREAARRDLRGARVPAAEAPRPAAARPVRLASDERSSLDAPSARGPAPRGDRATRAHRRDLGTTRRPPGPRRRSCSPGASRRRRRRAGRPTPRRSRPARAAARRALARARARRGRSRAARRTCPRPSRRRGRGRRSATR